MTGYQCQRNYCDELNIGAHNILTGYNHRLAKTIFTTAWAFSMRISEFSVTNVATIRKKKSHNIRENSVRTSDIGLSITFESNKIAKFMQAMKHRAEVWRKLLPLTVLIEEYMATHPRGTHNFFCTENCQPLDRNDILNLLDICLLQTEWRKFWILLHSFCQG